MRAAATRKPSGCAHCGSGEIYALVVARDPRTTSDPEPDAEPPRLRVRIRLCEPCAQVADARDLLESAIRA